MHLFPSRNPDKRGFTLIELIVAIVVLGILATFAIVGFRATIDRSTDAKQRARTQSVLREARTLYVQKIYQDPSYTWQQAIIDATADLPTFSTNAFAEGVSATGGTNLNTGTNGWTLEVDSGSGVYSSVSSELVFKVQSSTLYVASYSEATGSGVFGYVSQETPPVVWTASCSVSSCDAESAALGTPASGAYAPGTTATLLPTLSYSSTAFSLSGSSQVLSPTVTGSPTSYSYTGTLPSGVTFNTATGAFTGSTAWNLQATNISTSTGDSFSCALASGGVKCWGSNHYGQLGDGSTTHSSVPVQVSGLTSGVASISVGGYHTCAVTTSGGVKCWGYNPDGRLGDGTNTNRSTPVDVSGLTSGVASISAALTHTCVMTTSGGVKCWGYGTSGQLGDGTTTNRWTPVNVWGLTSGVASISADGHHTCAVTTSGGAKCWGYNSTGQLGDGTIGTERWTPVNVSGLTSGVASISAGGGHTCAVTTSGGAKCWGNNDSGQVGDGTVGTQRMTPVDVSGLTSGVASISTGVHHTCAMTTSGGAKCWGYNSTGQLGDGTTTERWTPVNVSGLTSGVASISADGHHTCAVTTSGGAKCWGYNTSGQLGDGTTTNRSTPVNVSGHTGNAGFPASITVTATNASGSTTTSVALSVS